MIRHPYGPDELDRTDPALDQIAEQLQAYASDERSAPPLDLAARIHSAVDAAPDPAVGWWARVVAPLSTPARGLAAAAVVVATVIAALVVGDLADLIRNPGTEGPTPTQPAIVSPSPSPTDSPSPSPTVSPSPSPTQSPMSEAPAPSPSDDHGGGGGTPAPSESDNSGPGGGGNSGPGGGGNSGPGGGSSGSDG